MTSRWLKGHDMYVRLRWPSLIPLISRFTNHGLIPLVNWYGAGAAEGGTTVGVRRCPYCNSVEQARRLKQLEQENTRLRRAVADLTLDKQILLEAARGNS